MHLVSSAKSKTLERDNVEGKSLTKMRKRTGPRILPCGTPEITGNFGEVDWPIETYWTTNTFLAPVIRRERSGEQERLQFSSVPGRIKVRMMYVGGIGYLTCAIGCQCGML